MGQAIYILLGWLLGLLSPGIAERIRRKYRKTELIACVLGELRELQYTMAWVAHMLRAHLGLVTDKFLDWVEPLMRDYDGPDAIPNIAEAMAKVRAMPKECRSMHLALRKPNRGLDLKEYSIPFLEAMAGEISICPLDFQRRVWRIKGQLDLFNQQVLSLRALFAKTFDPSITGNNREAVISNLNEGYEQLASRAQLIADAVSEAAFSWKK